MALPPEAAKWTLEQLWQWLMQRQQQQNEES